jgi:hypothetical protein
MIAYLCDENPAIANFARLLKMHSDVRDEPKAMIQPGSPRKDSHEIHR